MLNEQEYQQLKVAISHMHSPVNIGNKETCYKNHIMELLDQYTTKETT